MKLKKILKLSLVSLVSCLASQCLAQQAFSSANVGEPVTSTQSSNILSNLGPAAVVIQKLALGGMTDRPVAVTQQELDQAVEFLIKQASAKGQSLTKEQALVSLGLIAGSLSSFLDITQKIGGESNAMGTQQNTSSVPDKQASADKSNSHASSDLPQELSPRSGLPPSAIISPSRNQVPIINPDLPPGLTSSPLTTHPGGSLYVSPSNQDPSSSITNNSPSVLIPLPGSNQNEVPGAYTNPYVNPLTIKP